MTERIEVGDLVIVVRVCPCGACKCLGHIYQVLGFGMDVICGACGTLYKTPAALLNPVWRGAPLSWLKRIPPLAELESTETTVKEPA